MGQATSRDNENTWVPIPSLLASLSSDAQRQALEDAFCAGICGRVEDADQIFASSFPDPSSSAAVVLNWTENLRFYGRHRERRQMLEAFMNSSPPIAGSALEILTLLQLAESNLLVEGQCQPLVNRMIETRRYLKSRTADQLTDIEFRCITLYYTSTELLAQNSNYVGPREETCYLGGGQYGNTRLEECRAIREAFHMQGRLRFAAVIIQVELKYTPPTRREAALTAYNQILQSIIAAPLSPLKFRGAVLATQMASFHAANNDHEQQAASLQTHSQLLTELKPARYETWVEFCPVRADDDVLQSVLSSDESLEDKIETLYLLQSQHVDDKNFSKVSQIFRQIDTLISTSTQGSEETGQADKTRLSKQNQLKTLDFHRLTTQSAVEEAAALMSYIENEQVQIMEGSEVLKLIQDYRTRHKLMQIPDTVQRLSYMAIKAARAMNDESAVAFYERTEDNILHECSWMHKSAGLASEAVNCPHLSLQCIIAESREPSTAGMNALDLMLRWACHELQSGEISAVSAAMIFPPAILEYSTQLHRFASEQELWELSESIYDSICLVNSSIFVRRYRVLLDWALVVGRKVPRSARLHALRLLFEARIEQIQPSHLIAQIDKAGYKEVLNRETGLLAQLRILETDALETEENDVHDRRYRLALARPYDDEQAWQEELTVTLAECRQYTQILHEQGNNLKEYGSVIKCLDLRWRRFLLFEPRGQYRVAESEMIQLVAAAEEAYREVKESLHASVSSELSVLALASTAFNSAEHFKYELALLEVRYFEELENADITIHKLADRSLFFKGRGYIEELHQHTQQGDTSSNVAPELESLHADTSNLTLGHTEQSLGAVPAIARYDQVQSMVDQADDQIAVLDLIDLSQSAFESCVGVILYRKARPIALVNTDLPASAVQYLVQSGSCLRNDMMKTRYMLGTLQKLIAPFVDEADDGFVPEGVTMIWCLGDMFSHLPLAALDTGKGPLCTRNPLSCTDSLSSLYHQWIQLQSFAGVGRAQQKPVSFRPQTLAWDKFTQVEASLYGPETINPAAAKPEHVLENLQQVSSLLFAGKITFDPFDACNTILHFATLDTPHVPHSLDAGSAGEVTVGDVEARVALQPLALCSNLPIDKGNTVRTFTGDILALPAVLHTIGAGSVVALRWPLVSEDAALFATVFYSELVEASKSRMSSETSSDTSDGSAKAWQPHLVNVARVLQAATQKMLDTPSLAERDEPYFWASPYLSGLWLMPAAILMG